MIREEDFSRARIVVVDDEPANCRFLERLFAGAGAAEVTSTSDSREAVGLCDRLDPDLILLDLHMPNFSGMQILSELRKSRPAGAYLPVIVLTGDTSREARERAFENGARDFLTKPLDAMEVLLRSRNLIESHFLHMELERKVRDRTEQLETSRVEVLERLSRTAEYRDDVTGEHTRRVGELAARIGEAAGLPTQAVDHLRRAAPLHDLGKIAIPDHILLKPGPLTPPEFEVIKTHTTIGAEILSGGRSQMMRIAEEIAGSHHERWDGSGYPRGLSGEEIPLCARIVSIADVFDALTHDRPYRGAQPADEVIDRMHELRNVHFDGALVDLCVEAGLFPTTHPDVSARMTSGGDGHGSWRDSPGTDPGRTIEKETI
jgi:putative two-component system response regulator